MKRLTLLMMLMTSLQVIAQPELKIKKTASGTRVQFVEGNHVFIQSPAEGLWTVATGWSDNWPNELKHSGVDSMLLSGDFTLFYGHIQTGQGDLLCRDAYRIENGRIRGTRRFEWKGTDTLRTANLMLRFSFPARTKGIVMPGILYHGNPSGERSGNTPRYHGKAGEMAIFEEHRFPMPFVSAEWETEQGTLLGAALHSQPSPVAFANLYDQWWSMGVITGELETEMVLLSGPCAFNGQKSVIKSFQGGAGMAEPYPNAWINIPPGGIVEKNFWIDLYPVNHPGSGFQRAVHASLELFKPYNTDPFPSFDEIVSSKLDFAKTRYYEEDEVAGFRKYSNRNFFVLGWCGQAAAPGYALQVLRNRFKIPEAERMARRSLDFLSTSAFYEHGFYTWYNPDQNEWFMNHTPEWLSQGQAMLNFANAIRVAREDLQKPNPIIPLTSIRKWEQFLQKASSFHAGRILSGDWKPESTNEAFFIEPLCHAWLLFREPEFLDAAIKAGHHCAKRSLAMQEPYWGGTLDASCEDKEGAFAALQGFLSLHETTGDPEFLSWARHAADVCLSYMVVWDIPMPPGRLTDHAFKTRGWTAVSVQNMHIDVYGVLIAPYIHKLGKLTGEEALVKTGELMFRSCGQLIDPFGSQGEQPYQTNYIQTNWRDKPIWERRFAGS